MTDSKKLQNIRDQIDNLDNEILRLISKRGQLAKDVAFIKSQDGNKTSYYRPEREAQVLQKIITRNKGPLSDEEMARLFREIMSACLALEQQMTVAFLGPDGTFTQAAALKHFGSSIKTIPLAAIDEVFREVESGAANFGVVPIENSTEGVINHTLDMFMNSSLSICGEVELRVHHNLMGQMADISHIKKLYSHQQSLAQCREWLDSNLPHIDRISVSSNAEAARLAGEEQGEEQGVAAIAGEIAANCYRLNIINNNIEDEPDNTTRFLVIGREQFPSSGADKTSILVSTVNKPGALSRLLQPFAISEVSLTRIESRPSRQTMWNYVFFIDMEGHKDDAEIAEVLRILNNETAMLKILGSYPKALL